MRHRHRLSIAAATVLATMSIGVGALPAQAGKHKAPCRNGYVSLSFDDGPTASTPALLTALRRAGLRATFFDVGERAEAFPSYVVAAAADGHAIANHTYDHPDLTTLSEDDVATQLLVTQAILAPLAGTSPEFYRPPYGAINDAVRSVAASAALTEVIWTVDTNDWDGRSTAAIVDAALGVRAGGFVLMHDGYPNTVAAVPKIADGLERKGLCAGRITASSTPTIAWEGLAFPATVNPW